MGFMLRRQEICLKPIRIFPLLAAIGLLASPSSPAAPVPAQVTTLAASNNAFACALYAQLKTQDGNLFFSPFSVSSALAMTYAGARGNKATQMEQALRFPFTQTELHPAFTALSERLSAVQAG